MNNAVKITEVFFKLFNLYNRNFHLSTAHHKFIKEFFIKYNDKYRTIMKMLCKLEEGIETYEIKQMYLTKVNRIEIAKNEDNLTTLRKELDALKMIFNQEYNREKLKEHREFVSAKKSKKTV